MIDPNHLLTSYIDINHTSQKIMDEFETMNIDINPDYRLDVVNGQLLVTLTLSEMSASFRPNLNDMNIIKMITNADNIVIKTDNNGFIKYIVLIYDVNTTRSVNNDK